MGNSYHANAESQTNRQISPQEGKKLQQGRRALKSAATGNLSGVLRAARISTGDIHNEYIFEPKILGTGVTGPVRLALHRISGRQYAVKTFSKTGAKKNKINMLRNEVQIFLQLDHPNIARLLQIFEDDHKIYIVMELCSGELYDWLCVSKTYSESHTRGVALQMLAAINYLHAHGVVHRDLKLENWLYESTDENAILKLIDFGFSKEWQVSSNRRMQAVCGTPAYVSPDVLQGGYTNGCDMWSYGVIVYILLVGYPPFFGTEERIFSSVLSGDYSLTGPRWASVSHDAKHFVGQLLEINIDRRLTAKAAYEHPWLVDSSDRLSNIDINILQDMKRFAGLHNLKRAALHMMAYSLTSDEIKDLYKTFKAIDSSGDGTIKLDELTEVMQRYFYVSNDEIGQMFKCLDGSGNGEIEYNDLLAVVLMTRFDRHEHLIAETFRKFDTDNTGQITYKNLTDVLGRRYKEQALQEIMDEVDITKNHTIEFDEFLLLMKTESRTIDFKTKTTDVQFTGVNY